MYRVVSISRNVRLLLARNNVLALAGFSVISPKAPEQVTLLTSQEDVDAVVIGHSVDPETRKNIIRDLRRLCPGSLICFVYEEPDTAGEPLADVSLNVTKGPEPLILFLQARLPKDNSAMQL
jgi:predicted phosphodiesterase